MSGVPVRHLALVGPTASGKSELAVTLAEHLAERSTSGRTRGAAVLSADSMAVYRGMDIGTATPTPQQRARVPHHLIDLVEPHEEFSVARYRREAANVLRGLEERGEVGVLVGGTGLYVQSVVDDLDVPGRFPDVRAALDADPDDAGLHRRLVELDPLAAARIDPANRRRTVRALEVTIGSGRRFSDHGPGLDTHPPSPFLMIGLRPQRARLEPRIRARVLEQLEQGWLEEVRRLRDAPSGWSRTASLALGYPELVGHLDDECTLDEAVDSIVRRTRRFAVRQLRWFGRDPRITWFDAEPGGEALVEEVLGCWNAATRQ